MELTLHHVSIQISSNIDIKMTACCNDSDVTSSQIRRVDAKSRLADFENEVITISLDKIRRVGYQSKTRSRSNNSACDISMASDATKTSESVTLNIKLFAVSDQRSKLIGLCNIPIDWKLEGPTLVLD